MTPFPKRSMIAALAGTASVALLAVPAAAAPGGPGAKGHCAKPGILSVSGHGEARVAPDQVMISLGVTTQADTAAQAMQDNATRQQAVLDTLQGAGVDEGDIQTSGLSLNPMMNYPSSGAAPSIEGYMAQNLLTVRVTEIARAGEVLDSIVGAGANEMQGIRFIRDDSQAAEDEALKLAVDDATHRAQVMAEAAGVELGPIMKIGEPKAEMVPPGPVMMRAMGAEADAKSIPVEGGEVAFTADVDVSFSLGGNACDMAKPDDNGSGPADAQPPAEAQPREPAPEGASQPDPAPAETAPAPVVPAPTGQDPAPADEAAPSDTQPAPAN